MACAKRKTKRAKAKRTLRLLDLDSQGKFGECARRSRNLPNPARVPNATGAGLPCPADRRPFGAHIRCYTPENVENPSVPPGRCNK